MPEEINFEEQLQPLVHDVSESGEVAEEMIQAAVNFDGLIDAIKAIGDIGDHLAENMVDVIHHLRTYADLDIEYWLREDFPETYGLRDKVRELLLREKEEAKQ